MRRLVIETAGLACSVALFEDGALIDAVHEVVGRGHAERLLPMIAGLAQGGRADAILVDCGPGSFTGVRVGLAAARGLGLGWNAAVSGYSSLALLAASRFAETGAATLTIAIPGGHGELFVQRFSRAPFTALTGVASLAPDAIAAADLFCPEPSALDARSTGGLPKEWTALSPSPIYGRGADARPMA